MKNYNKISNINNEGPKREPAINSSTHAADTTAKIITDKPTPIQTLTPIKGVVANCKALNVRTCANRESEVIKVIGEGTVVTVIPDYNIELDAGTTEKWLYIQLDNGVHGYIIGAFLKEE